METVFAGNLTHTGSAANLIAAESAKKEGVELSFGVSLKAGSAITLATIILGTL